jgi:ssDNA-binding Zn-finger/Zn-ribbon topoisomerase 1
VRDEIDWSKLTQACPKCGGTMVVRQNRSNGSRFMGCSNWPLTCTHTAPIPTYALLIAQGAAILPGFE